MKLNSKSINYNVQTVDELVSLDGLEGDTVVVTDENRGGVFVYREDNVGTNNGGTIFNGWTRQYSGSVNVKWFGAKGDGVTDAHGNYISGTTDDYAIIQNVVNNFDSVIIPSGSYFISQRVRLYNASLILEAGTHIVKPNISGFNSVSSMFWLNGTASIKGNGALSIIRSEVNSPNGVITIGQENPEVEGLRYASYNELDGVSIFTTKNETIPSVSIMMNGTTDNVDYRPPSYYNRVNNIIIEDSDIGLYLRARANGNTINNIRIIGIRDTGLFLHGCVDNSMSNIMIDAGSTPAKGLVVKDYVGLTPLGEPTTINNKNNNIQVAIEMYSPSPAYPIVAEEADTSLSNTIVYSMTGPSAPQFSDLFKKNNCIISTFEKILKQDNFAYDNDSSAFISNTLSSGAVVERGSNANGTYIKFADGTMICTTKKAPDVAFAQLTTFTAATACTRTDFNYPASFSAVPVTSVNIISTANAYYQNIVSAIVRGNYSSASRVTYYFGATNPSYIDYVEVIAIGKWK